MYSKKTHIISSAYHCVCTVAVNSGWRITDTSSPRPFVHRAESCSVILAHTCCMCSPAKHNRNPVYVIPIDVRELYAIIWLVNTDQWIYFFNLQRGACNLWFLINIDNSEHLNLNHINKLIVHVCTTLTIVNLVIIKWCCWHWRQIKGQIQLSFAKD